MSHPSALWIPHPTADGSMTFLSSEFGEYFHSLNGAWDEALCKFVGPTRLLARSQEEAQLGILDVCYGLGYNSAAALMVIWSIAPQTQVRLLGLELDQSVAIAALPELLETLQRFQGTQWQPQAVSHGQPEPILLTAEAADRTGAVLTDLAKTGVCSAPYFEGAVRWGDARQTFGQGTESGAGDHPPPGQGQFDAIFLDPFSPPQCPQLWTTDFVAILAEHLAPQGYLATYSCAAAVRTALLEAGLELGASPPFGRRWPGTVAAHPGTTPNPHLPALSRQELEHLGTRAAVPYRDRQGTNSREVILERRQQEQQQSILEPTSQWKRRWFGDCRASHRSTPLREQPSSVAPDKPL